MGAMHMALLGPSGVKNLAIRNAAACEMAKRAVLSIPGIELLHNSTSGENQTPQHYNEFTVVLPSSATSALSFLDSRGVTGGLALSDIMEGADDSWLLILSLIHI